MFVFLIIANGLVVYGAYDNREKFYVWQSSTITRLTEEINQLERIPNRFPPQNDKLAQLKSELDEELLYNQRKKWFD